MDQRPLIEIRDWGRRPRRVALSGPIVVGRDCAGEVLLDSEVSREHLRVVPSPTALSVVDLGSSNGTTLNGVALTGRARISAGDVLRLGRSEIIVLSTPAARGSEQPTSEPDFDATRMNMRAISLPPPPPVVEAKPSPAAALAERVLGIDPTGERELFPAYTELPTRVPLRVWQAIRVCSVAAYFALVVTLFVRPAAGLFIFFGIIVPLLPVLFLVAPGLWRNICPMAATNQIPRVFGFGRALNPPDWLRNRGYLIAMALFFGIAGARLAGLDQSGPATGVVLALMIAAAFAGGYVFKGKSGWCSSICPLFPVQRVYGQTPYVTVPNSHCKSCVGCAKNCYDFKPRAAYQADLADTDRGWSGARKLFVAALPGFILGFFTMVRDAEMSTAERYPVLVLFVLVSIGLFYAVEAVSPLSPAMVAVIYAAAALNIFYWFAGPVLVKSLAEVSGVDLPWVRWLISAAIAAATLLWIARTRVSELQFAWTTGARAEPVLLMPPKLNTAAQPESAARVRFEADGAAVAAEVGTSLLDVAERNNQPIEAGCRMGVCGADPVAVLDGMSCLTPPGQDELNTLRRTRFWQVHPDGVLRADRVGIGDGFADSGTGRRGWREADALRPLDRQRRCDRRWHRRGHRGRLRPSEPPRLRDPSRRAGVTCALQPDGDLPPGVRPFCDAGPLPASRAVVRRPRCTRVAEHCGPAHRRPFAARGARYRGSAAVRPVDSRDGIQRVASVDRRLGPAGQLRPASGRRRDATPRLRSAAWLPQRRCGRWRIARDWRRPTRCTFLVYR